MDSKQEDYNLVKKFLNGDESAFNRLATKYQENIYWVARRMTGNHLDADEIVQEVFLVMYKKLHTFKFQSSLYTWIYKITSTRCLNFIRKRGLKKFFSLEDKETLSLKSNEDIILNIEKKEEMLRIEKILQKIPPRQRQVFVLRHFEEMSYEDISKILNSSVGALKANYFHAVKKLTEIMNENK